LQPFVPGRAASVAVLAGPAGRVPLQPAAQHLSDEGRFHYQGGALPMPPDLGVRARRLADAVVAAVPGLCGYLGVDLVMGEAADGAGDQVIEINPRLTTSYVGLRRLARFNLAEVLLRVARGEPAGVLDWRPGRVCFLSDGTCRPDPAPDNDPRDARAPPGERNPCST
jgi:predicted ATP-grasp superfamily ATP-dependent carboligase